MSRPAPARRCLLLRTTLPAQPRLAVLALLLPAACALATWGGCRRGDYTYVWVQQARYEPNLPPVLQDYRGRAIYMPSFENQAEDTSTYYYYSRDRSVTYEGAPSLASYMWYSFEKALQSVGLEVHAEPPAEGARPPELRLFINTWNDEECRYRVALLRGERQVHDKEYTVVWDKSPSKDATALEQRAYRMMDAMVLGVLADPGFKTAFLGE